MKEEQKTKLKAKHNSKDRKSRKQTMKTTSTVSFEISSSKVKMLEPFIK